MGYEFPVNFKNPYISSSLREFWTRWHVSLSSWFRDYLYVPMGGGTHGRWTGIRNMAITMLVSGLWHGAAWNFVIWGALHATYLALERLTEWPKRVAKLPFGQLTSTALVIVQVWIAWVFFRATSFQHATEIVRILFDWRTFRVSEFTHLRHMQGMDLAVLYMTLAIFWEMLAYRQESGRSDRPDVGPQALPILRKLEPVLVSIGLLASIYLRGPGSNFIYFQF
jgi:alginate O-acetyltransferase complex protein AlgI